MRDERAGVENEERGQRLREELEVERKRAGGVHHWRCLDELRERIVAYAVACSAEGESHRRIAGRLGLAQCTLSRWVRAWGESSGGFRQVAIVPAGHREHLPAAASLRVVTPNGFVVEGLDLEHLTALLRVLG